MNATSEVLKIKVEESFGKWLAKPETKLLLSMIPAADNSDVMQVLLRSCYESGHGSGEGAVAVMMIEAMLKDKPKRDEFR